MTNGMDGEDVSGSTGTNGKNTETPINGGGSDSSHGFKLVNTKTSRGNMPLSVAPSHSDRPEKFKGVNFKTWQQKMLFYLTMLGLASFVKNDPPTLREDDLNNANAIEAWTRSDFICSNYILNGLTDALYSVYQVKETTKELWEALEHKYKSEDVEAKKFLVGQFLNFTMVDSKSVIGQVQDLHLIIHDILVERMVISEIFQVAAIIEKLPHAWNDFKNYLKHKRKEISVEELVVRLRIEEENRGNAEKASKYSVAMASQCEARANMVEHMQDSKKKGKSKLGPKGGVSKKPKFVGKCYNCNKLGHKSADCRLPRKANGNEANIVDAITQEVSDIDLDA